MDNTSQDQKPLPGSDDIRALLKFLPIFERPDFMFGKEEGGEKRDDGVITMPYYTMSDDASRFHSTLYQHGFIRSFDWGSWKHKADRYVNDPSLLNSAELETLCKLLTLHARAERFCDGHLASMYDCGHLLALLHRLSQLVD